MVDFTFVGNVVYGLLLAATELFSPSSLACGKAYFITNEEPIAFWQMLSTVLLGLGYEAPFIYLPYSVCATGKKYLLHTH